MTTMVNQRRRLFLSALAFAICTYFYLDSFTSRDSYLLLPSGLTNGSAFEIDLVITYVNGSEETWLTSFLKEREWAKRQKERLLPYAASENRFHDHDDLRYLLRSVDLYGPTFFRRVHLVVASEAQIPAWLNRRHPRLHVVYHREIFYNSSHLPTFNSLAVEANLHHIDGLAEYYIYANDDLAFLSPPRIGAFVDAVDPSLGIARSIIVRPDRNINIENQTQAKTNPLYADYLNPAMNARDVVMAFLKEGRCEGADVRKIRAILRNPLSHTPKLFIRSVLLEAEKEERVLQALNATSERRFRSGKEINVSLFFPAYAECTSRVEVKLSQQDGLLYIALDEAVRWRFLFDAEVARMKAFYKTRLLPNRGEAQFLCVNDINAVVMPTPLGVKFAQQVKNFRGYLFPYISSFEVVSR